MNEKEKIIARQVAELKREELEIKNMISHCDYFDWIVRFMKNKNGFSSEDWYYYSENNSDVDRKNLGRLGLFFNGIEKYAKDNYIYPSDTDYGSVYRIKYNGAGYELGVLYGLDIVYFCKRAVINKNKKFIDYEDIMNGKRQDNVNVINESLLYLSNMIHNLHEGGIPLEALEETFNNCINDIKFNEDDIEDLKLIR